MAGTPAPSSPAPPSAEVVLPSPIEVGSIVAISDPVSHIYNPSTPVQRRRPHLSQSKGLSLSAHRHAHSPALQNDGSPPCSPKTPLVPSTDPLSPCTIEMPRSPTAVQAHQEQPEQPNRPRLGSQLTEKMFVILAGMLLSFNSGYINGCCMSGALAKGAPEQSVAGFTGAYTNAGLEAARGADTDFRFHVQMILSFIAGATITGIMDPKAKPNEIGPQYGPTFLLGALLLASASVIAEEHPTSKAYYYLAAAANGLQNGMSSTYSANLIRSTHLTGTSTDIGIILGQVIRGERQNLWKLFVLVGLAASFFLGSFTSYFAVQEWAEWSLIFNAALFTAIGLGCIVFVSWQNNVSLLQAATGTWTWDVVISNLRHGLGVFTAGDPKVHRSTMLLDDMFNAIDHAGRGFIDKANLRRAMLQAGVNCCEDCIQKLIEQADKDGDGKVNRTDWQKVIEREDSINPEIPICEDSPAPGVRHLCRYCHKRSVHVEDQV